LATGAIFHSEGSLTNRPLMNRPLDQLSLTKRPRIV